MRAERVFGLVPAAGEGRRFGDAEPKQFLCLAGESALAWSLRRLLEGGVGRLVVALPPGREPETRLRERHGEAVRWIAGGTTRQASVARCLEASEADDADLVAVHDAARPAVHPRDVARVVAAASRTGAAVLGRPVGDTVKRAARGEILGTLDRGELWRAETPQVFRAELLHRAFALAARDGFSGTDESSLVERLGDVRVTAVPADAPNPKLTWRGDELWLAALLTASDESRNDRRPS